MTEYFPKPNSLRGNVIVQLDLSNYATKTDLRKCNMSKTDRANLKSDIDN